MVICIVVICLLVISADLSNADDYDWPRWRGPNGDGISTETDWNPEALAGSPKILWKVNIGLGHSNVAIKANRLYTMGQRGRENIIYCFNAETGEEIWKHSFECFQDPQSTPNLDNKYVYALSKDGILLCLTAKNGKVQWQKDIVDEYNVEIPGYGIAGSPIIEGDLLILNANTSGITLDKKQVIRYGRANPDVILCSFLFFFIRKLVNVFSNKNTTFIIMSTAHHRCVFGHGWNLCKAYFFHRRVLSPLIMGYSSMRLSISSSSPLCSF